MSIGKARQLWHWLRELWHTWLALLVIVVALAIAFSPGTGEPRIRLTGLFLQIFGIVTVAWGISETRKLFGHPTLLSQAASWLLRFPLRNRSASAVGGNASIRVSAIAGRAHGTSGPEDPSSVVSRIESLERNVVLLNDRISATQSEIDTVRRETGEAHSQEAKIRESHDLEIRQKLEAAGTGGVHISAIGAVWLFFGVVLSTAGVEIARALSYTSP